MRHCLGHCTHSPRAVSARASVIKGYSFEGRHPPGHPVGDQLKSRYYDLLPRGADEHSTSKPGSKHKRFSARPGYQKAVCNVRSNPTAGGVVRFRTPPVHEESPTGGDSLRSEAPSELREAERPEPP